MNAEEIKRLIRKGQTAKVIFAECPTSPLDIVSEIQKIIHFDQAILIIGVKPCGTVVGLRNKEAEVMEIIQPLISSTSLLLEKIDLIRYFSVLVVSSDKS